MRFFFKFKEKIKDAERAMILNELEKKGVKNISMVFPESNDSELSRLYFALDESAELAKDHVEYLHELKQIEYAELESKRKGFGE